MSFQTYDLVDTAPASIFPAGQQGRLTVRNVGTAPVYLVDNPIAGLGWNLAVGDCVSWNRATPLYASVVTAGMTSRILVTDANDLLPLSAVNATVSGIVNVGAPVNVQGGGEILYANTLTCTNLLAPGVWGATATVPAPASGLTYYGLRARITIPPPGVFDPVGHTAWWTISATGGPAHPPTGTLYLPPTPLPLYTYSIASHIHQFTMPMIGAYPLTVSVHSNIANDLIDVEIAGVSQADAFPRTDFSIITELQRSYTTCTASQTSTIYLPPSFQPYEVRFLLNGGINASAGYELLEDWTWGWLIVRPHLSQYYWALPTAYNVTNVYTNGSGRAGMINATMSGAHGYVVVQPPHG